MKLIIREYLSSLRERDELDAILPDLLSEIGFNVISRPSRGSRQYGVDVAAVGPDENDGGKRKLFLFSIKSGDLNRQDWDGTPQALRSSLNEIKDVYIPTHISKQYDDVDIVICICMGGDIREPVRLQWSSYIKDNTTSKVSFAEWNGDKLAELILTGVLGREILSPDQRSTFQKAVAMVDQPDIAYSFFLQLINALFLVPKQNAKQKKTSLRQGYICLWVIFVWAREANNFDAPYRASEVAMLYSWQVGKEYAGKGSKDAKEILGICDQFLKLHLTISEYFIQNKIRPFSGKLHALSTAVNSQTSTDVCLALFEILGRVGLFGLWCYHMSEKAEDETSREVFLEKTDEYLNMGIQMINNNPVLCSPLRDDHTIEIMIFLLLAQACDRVQSVSGWIEEISNRCVFSIRSRGKYPTSQTNYVDLTNHPRDSSDEYFEQATCGSILYPFLATWLAILGRDKALKDLADCIASKLSHCTQQLWLPDEDTDNKIWIGDRYHGKAVTALPIESGGAKLFEMLEKISTENVEVNKISAISYGLWPLFISACRHYRMPLPPHLWTMYLNPSKDEV